MSTLLICACLLTCDVPLIPEAASIATSFSGANSNKNNKNKTATKSSAKATAPLRAAQLLRLIHHPDQSPEHANATRAAVEVLTDLFGPETWEGRLEQLRAELGDHDSENDGGNDEPWPEAWITRGPGPFAGYIKKNFSSWIAKLEEAGAKTEKALTATKTEAEADSQTGMHHKPDLSKVQQQKEDHQGEERQEQQEQQEKQGQRQTDQLVYQQPTANKASSGNSSLTRSLLPALFSGLSLLPTPAPAISSGPNELPASQPSSSSDSPAPPPPSPLGVISMKEKPGRELVGRSISEQRRQAYIEWVQERRQAGTRRTRTEDKARKNEKEKGEGQERVN